MQCSRYQNRVDFYTFFLSSTADKSEWISSKISLHITLGFGIMSCENEMSATKKQEFYKIFPASTFPDTRLEIHALPFCPVNLICKAPPKSSGYPIRFLSLGLHLGCLRFSWPLEALLATWHHFGAFPALTALITIWRAHGRSTPSWLLHAILATTRLPGQLASSRCSVPSSPLAPHLATQHSSGCSVLAIRRPPCHLGRS